ncbi:hypothetical protein [Streptomyces sp. MMBL 11-3]|uniref:hypothetical protein n=1 Tax=Streptomyces sp. MMBL 11-3 TaxID=3382639 RepID=UPI0039B3F29D
MQSSDRAPGAIKGSRVRQTVIPYLESRKSATRSQTSRVACGQCSLSCGFSDPPVVDNPARAAALRTVRDREKDLATAERRLARLVESPLRPVAKINQQIPAARTAVEQAEKHLATARSELKQIPVKIPANQLHPGQQRACL